MNLEALNEILQWSLILLALRALWVVVPSVADLQKLALENSRLERLRKHLGKD
jgi:hypothetical protein